MDTLQDLKNTCGCYELGSFCYDKTGEPTHAVGEQCEE